MRNNCLSIDISCKLTSGPFSFSLEWVLAFQLDNSYALPERVRERDYDLCSYVSVSALGRMVNCFGDTGGGTQTYSRIMCSELLVYCAAQSAVSPLVVYEE